MRFSIYVCNPIWFDWNSTSENEQNTPKPPSATRHSLVAGNLTRVLYVLDRQTDMHTHIQLFNRIALHSIRFLLLAISFCNISTPHIFRYEKIAYRHNQFSPNVSGCDNDEHSIESENNNNSPDTQFDRPHTNIFNFNNFTWFIYLCKQTFTIHMRANKMDFSRKDFFSPIWCSRNVVHGAVNNLFPLESTLLNCCLVFHFFLSLWTFDSFHWFSFAYPDLHCESWSNALVRCVRVW